jgi:hypothetical protein
LSFCHEDGRIDVIDVSSGLDFAFDDHARRADWLAFSESLLHECCCTPLSPRPQAEALPWIEAPQIE